jgi:hypothetical protein
MATEVITLKDALSRTVLQQAIERERRALNLSVAVVSAKLEAFEKKYGALDRDALYGKADDLELIEWEGEQETLARLRARLERLEGIRIESR